MTDFFESMEILYNVSSFLRIISTVVLFIFMHFSSKHRNKNLGLKWYIAGFFVPEITFLVFLSKRKRFPGENMKVCPVCGDKYPETYEICGRCLVELPENKPEEKKKQNSVAKISSIAFVILFFVDLIFGGIILVKSLPGVIDEFLNSSYTLRISVNDVYYDKNGNSYENSDEVPIYDEKGNTYTYLFDEETFDSFYVDSKGKKYRSFDCYVSEDGWFFYDENYEFQMEETEDDEYWSEDILSDDFEYFYYEYKYYDYDGNVYYLADEASWNEKGELITEKNHMAESE